ncbi:MAG: hypothetical protein DRO88_00460 [Promethearchaeia archaeon]|nr:MAG: hypothetical protein DRO88_00460 [Candidatus Lokiarchaeia archaeon]
MAPHRPDATLVKGISKYQELAFHIMPRRNDSFALFPMKIDVDNAINYLEKTNVNRSDKITLFDIILTALAQTLFLRPRANRFVSGGRLWQRNQIKISFVVKREKSDDGEEVNATLYFQPNDTLFSIHDRLHEEVYNARQGENPNAKDVKFFGSMPRWFIKLLIKLVWKLDKMNLPINSITKDLPMFSTIYLAHLGSLNMHAIFHHLFEMGTTSIFAVIGKIHRDTVVNQETGEVEVHRVIHLNFNLDERIADGIYWGKTLDILQNFIENPQQLESPLNLTEEQIIALHLKEEKSKTKRK